MSELDQALALLDAAAGEDDRLRRHLLVAAALACALPTRIVIVGGVAEDYWAQDPYTPTDLDVTGDADPAILAALGFMREEDRRHWYHPSSAVVVEFPVSRLEGDWDRVVAVDVGGGVAEVISLEDIYLDRLRQSTAEASKWKESVPFLAALAIASSRSDIMDWAYVARAIRASVMHASELRARDNEVRRRIRRGLGVPPAGIEPASTG